MNKQRKSLEDYGKSQVSNDVASDISGHLTEELLREALDGLPAELDREYRRRRLAVCEDPALSWEKKELAIRQLGLELRKALKELEEDAA